MKKLTSSEISWYKNDNIAVVANNDDEPVMTTRKQPERVDSPMKELSGWFVGAVFYPEIMFYVVERNDDELIELASFIDAYQDMGAKELARCILKAGWRNE